MKLVVSILGVFLVAAGISLIINPALILDWIEDILASRALFIAAIVGRFIFGMILIIAAKESNFPNAIKLIGGVAILAAVIFLFTEQQNFQELLSTIIVEFKSFAALSGVVSMLFGGFLIYAFYGNIDKH